MRGADAHLKDRLLGQFSFPGVALAPLEAALFPLFRVPWKSKARPSTGRHGWDSPSVDEFTFWLFFPARGWQCLPAVTNLSRCLNFSIAWINSSLNFLGWMFGLLTKQSPSGHCVKSFQLQWTLTDSRIYFLKMRPPSLVGFLFSGLYLAGNGSICCVPSMCPWVGDVRCM